MGALQKIREFFALPPPRPDSVIARTQPTWKLGRPLPQPNDYRHFAQEGYRRNSLIFACIVEIATSAAEPTLKVVRSKKSGTLEEVTDHELTELLSRPNPAQPSQYQFLQTWVTHLHVAGNAYLHKVRSSRGNVVQLWLLRPDRMRIKPDVMGMVKEYEYSVEGNERKIPVAAEDIAHSLLHPDPLDDYYGLSPIAVLARIGDLDTQAAEFLRAFFFNAGIPAGLLKFKGRVTAEERERVKGQWREQYGGVIGKQVSEWAPPATQGGWHDVAVLDADVEFEELASKEIGRFRLSPIWETTESRICSALGVPPVLVGALVGLAHSTYSNYRESRKSFWDETLSPMYRRLGDTLTTGLAYEYGPDFRVMFDTSNIEALQEKQEDKRKWAVDGWTNDLLTRNEARAIVGMDPVQDDEDGDSFKSAGAAAELEAQLAAALAPPANGSVPPNGNGTPKALPVAAQRRALTNGHTHAVTDGTGSSQIRTEVYYDGRHAADPSWKALHRVADAADPKLRSAFLRAVANTRLGADRAAIEAALVVGDLDGATAAVRWAEIGEAELLEALPPILQQTAIAAGKASEAVAPVGVGFNVTNPRVLAWAQAHGAELVVDVSASLRAALRAALTTGVEAGLPPQQTARLLLDAGLGLTERQVNAVTSFRQRQLDDGLSDEKALKNAEKYGRRLLRQRAAMIGRTESITASSRGQLELWRQAKEAGTITDDARRVWVVTDDDRLDEEICAPMEGQRVKLDESFTGGDGTRALTPPIHVGCRCAVSIDVG